MNERGFFNMKKIFLINLSVLMCVFVGISDAMAWANCTQAVPAGKYCKTAGSKPDCPVGCYCTGSKHAVGLSINVAKSCQERTHQAELNASGIFFCPEGMTSIEGSFSVDECYTIGTAGMLGTKPCVPGCFCVNNGQMEHDIHNKCGKYQSQSIISYCIVADNMDWHFDLGSGESAGILSCDRNYWAHYYVDEFSELYMGDYGMYGIMGDNLIVMPFHGINAGIYQCPSSYPSSDSGAKTVYDCYKYDANGNKVYYGANTNIVCAEGTYLPANATQCVACSASQNQVCPGGRFEKLDKIQGLRLNCPTGKYLPANATQCSSCDESQYFCFGGIYDYNSSEDQGRIAHNGYVNMGEHHTFITCNPGKYVPANTNQCSACTGDYICPGGIFFTDATYNVDRGKKLCPYGQPNATHTACVGKSSKPSYAREHLSNVINKPAESTSVMKQKIGKNEKVVSVATEKTIADSGETKASTVNTENTKKSVETKKNIDDSKNVKSSTAEKKLDLGKISAPLAPKFDRALTQRPVPVSANIQETTDINSVVRGTMNEKSEQKRPSRYR